MDLNDVRKLFKDYREKAGKSQKEVASACGFPNPRRYGNFERGDNTPTPQEIERVCQYFGIPFELESTIRDENQGAVMLEPTVVE